MAVEERLAWAQRMREAFEREHRADSRLRRQIGERHRAERALLERLLAAVRGGAPADPLLEAVRTIGRAAARAAAELHELRRTGRLQAEIPDLAASYAHMHLNRIHRDQQRPQELVIYSFLERTYRSWLARGAGR